MIGYQIEETIDRPVAEVFRYVGDPTLHPQWSDVSDVQVATPGEVRIGTQVRETMKVGSRKVPFMWEVTDFEANSKMAFRTIEGPMTWEGGYEVSASDNGATRITGWGRLGLKGWRRVLEPFMGGEVRRGEAAELRRLKDLLERPS